MHTPEYHYNINSSIPDTDMLEALHIHVPDYAYFKNLQSNFLKRSESHPSHFGRQGPKEMIGTSDFDYISEVRFRNGERRGKGSQFFVSIPVKRMNGSED